MEIRWCQKGSTAGVTALPGRVFEWLPWSYWRYEGRRCCAAKEPADLFFSLLNSRLESFHLLNTDFRVDRLVLFKQFVMCNPLPVPPYAQHRFTRMNFFCHLWCRLFTRAKSSLALLHVDVQAPCFVTSNDSVKKSLLVSIG